jgi:hypothetical protein
MKLTGEQQKVFADWVRVKMEHHACSLCQANHWKIGELLVPASSLALDEVDAKSMPGMVQLVCQNCASVLLFDVRRIPHWNEHDVGHSAIM